MCWDGWRTSPTGSRSHLSSVTIYHIIITSPTGIVTTATSTLITIVCQRSSVLDRWLSMKNIGHVAHIPIPTRLRGGAIPWSRTRISSLSWLLVKNRYLPQPPWNRRPGHTDYRILDASPLFTPKVTFLHLPASSFDHHKGWKHCIRARSPSSLMRRG